MEMDASVKMKDTVYMVKRSGNEFVVYTMWRIVGTFKGLFEASVYMHKVYNGATIKWTMA